MPALARLGPIQYTYYLTFVVDFQNAARDCIAHVDEMIAGDEQTERMPQFPFTEKTAA